MSLKKLNFCVLLVLLCISKVAVVYAVDNYSDDSDDQTESVVITGKSHDAIGNMLLQSISLMGIPYRWGGNTPQTGMDCSGFIRYVFQKSMGITLPRTAAEMAKVGKRVSVDDLEPGDLLFFNTRRGSNTHIGMYIGNNQFIQSPHTGDKIKITTLDASWRAKLNGAKRIVQEDEDDEGDTTIESYQDITDEGLPIAHHYRMILHCKRHHKCRVVKVYSHRGRVTYIHGTRHHLRHYHSSRHEAQHRHKSHKAKSSSATKHTVHVTY